MFTDFHTRSAFSFLEAASLPEDLVQRAADLGHAAMALMDRDNLCGAPRFYMAAKKIGAKAHIGAEITGADGDSYPLLAENRTGYQNLCRLITSMKLRAPKGKAAASEEELANTPQDWSVSPAKARPRARDSKNSSVFSARKTCTPNCSATFIAMKKRAIRP